MLNEDEICLLLLLHHMQMTAQAHVYMFTKYSDGAKIVSLSNYIRHYLAEIKIPTRLCIDNFMDLSVKSSIELHINVWNKLPAVSH